MLILRVAYHAVFCIAFMKYIFGALAYSLVLIILGGVL